MNEKELEEKYYEYFSMLSTVLPRELEIKNRYCVRGKVSLDILNDVNKRNRFEIHIYSNESGHNIPHFHLVGKSGLNLSISIMTCEVIKGKVSGKNAKQIRKICNIIAGSKDSKDILSKIWNDSNAHVKVELSD